MIWSVVFGASAVGVAFRAWVYLFENFSGSSAWIAPTTFSVLLAGVVGGAALPRRLARYGLPLAPLLLLIPHPESPFVSLALFLPTAVLGGARLAGTPAVWNAIGLVAGIVLAEALLIPFLGAPIAGAAAGLLAIASVLHETHGEQLVQTGRSRGFSAEAFFLSAISLLFWQRTLSFTLGSTGALVAFSLVQGLAAAAALRFPADGISKWAPWTALTAVLLIPGILSPSLYPYGSGGWIGPSLLLVLIFVIAPTVYLCWTGIRSSSDSVNSLNPALGVSALVGLVASALGILWIGTPWTQALLSLVALAWLWRVRFKRERAVLHLGAALILIAGAFVESDRFWAPPEETIVAQAIEGGDQYALTRSRTDGDIRIRRNYHHLMESLQPFKSLRRHTLLPMRLAGYPQHVLIVGGHNPIGISAALEQGPRDLTILESRGSLFEFSKWFTSATASANRETQVKRSLKSTFGYLNSTSDYYDVAIIEDRPPWYPGATLLHSRELLEQVRDRLFPRAVVAQWFYFYQWSPETFSRVVATWKEVFGAENISLWRDDLLPDYPRVALIAQIGNAEKHLKEAPKRPPAMDIYLENLPGTMSLFVADANGLKREFADAKPIEVTQPQLELISGFERAHPGKLIPFTFMTRFLASSSASEGAGYGGLLWTRAVLDYRNGQKNWREDRIKAQQLMGLDLSKEYPHALPE